MAIPIKRIEKDFILKVLYDEQTPLLYHKDRGEYVLTVAKPSKDEIFLKSNRPVEGLKVRNILNLIFDFRGQIVTFNAEITSVRDDLITAISPDFLYKNLDRSYSRVQTPPDLQVQFTFLEDFYSLSYPRLNTYDPGDMGAIVQNMDPKNFNDLIKELAAWAKDRTSGYKLVLFKDESPPTSTEEKVIAELGRCIFITSTMGNLPSTDPFPKSRLVTEEMFKRYLENTGVDPVFLHETCTRFVKTKLTDGILSDLWIPILFQEYVIGYIHVWIDKADLPPFDYAVIDILYQFAAILSHSLKINGFFESGKLENKPFYGNVIDISASGLLFVYPQTPMATSLLPDYELSIDLITPRRKVSTNAKIVRRYNDKIQWYFGVRFLDMAPEDVRFLFEFIYGKPIADSDIEFLVDQV